LQMAHPGVGGRQRAWDGSRRDVRPTVDSSGSPLPGAAHPLPTLAAPAACAGRAPPTHLAAPHEPATADHHGWPWRAGMVPLGTAQLRRYLVLAWRLLALQALESPTLPRLRSEHPRSSSSWPLHSRYAGGGFGRLVKAACQAGGLGLVRAHLCIKRPPGRAAATIAARMGQTF